MKKISQINQLCLHKKRLSFYIAALSGTALAVPTIAQEQGNTLTDKVVEEVVVTGIRASIQSAQDLKRDANVIQDSIVAEDIGKLPDRSIAEALQRVAGVSVSRFDNPSDPEHFAGEGAGVSIRGLTQVRAELNGRDIFSAADGRSLSFDDVPAELMAGVDVIKTPTADMVEGGLGGIVNLRTRMPFDQNGQLISGTVKANYGDIIKETNSEASVLYSNNWETDVGQLGLLFDISDSTTSSRADNLYVRSYFPRTFDEPFKNPLIGEKYGTDTFYVPRGADWRRNDYERQRTGKYLALQWQPTEDLDFYATAFESNAQRDWFENGFFLDGGGGFPQYLPTPGNYVIEGMGDDAIVVGYDADDWVFDSRNALVSGTMTAPGGVPFGTSSRTSSNKSTTTDLSFGVEWVKGQYTFSGDYQRVMSSAKAQDFTYGTVAFPSYISVTGLNSSDNLKIVDVDNHLSDLTNYSFGQMQSQPKDNKADSTALRLDVKYDFEESLVNSVKLGVRFSERSANNRSASNWSARVQPWNTCCWGGIPTISENNPLMRPFSFDNFQRGDAEVPVSGWMFTEEALKDFRGTTEAMVAQSQPPADSTWVASSPKWGDLDLQNPSNVSRQKNETTAVYVMADFSVNDLFGGNVGVRYVSTSTSSIGYLAYSRFEEPGGTMPYYKAPKSVDYKNDYDFILPSINLRYSPLEDVVLRFSASKQIWKPEFSETEADQSLEADWNDTTTQEERAADEFVFDRSMVDLKLESNDKYPLLEPMEAVQLDVTAEWYFNDAGGMLYAGWFKKDVSELFRTQTERIDFEEWSNVSRNRAFNVGTADVNGIELGGTYYFDMLPAPFNGFGVSGNYTHIDSESEVPTESGAAPVDTDGGEIKDIPLEGLAEKTYNFTAMYEYSGFYARLAYSWHSEVFQDIGPNGWNGENYGINWKLPVYADDYGQLDFSTGYDITDNFSVNFEAYNLLKEDTKGFMRQNEPGDHTAYVYTNDVRYGLSLRVTF